MSVTGHRQLATSDLTDTRDRRSSRWRVLLTIVLMLMLASACGGDTNPVGELTSASSPDNSHDEEATYMNVDPATLTEMLTAKDFQLVNVHVPYDGEIAGTDRFIPYTDIGQQLDQLPADRDAKIVLYCLSGRMSEIAARELITLGYTNVWNLDGGMNRWEQSGLPLQQRQP
jgi:rhodanese-related sulfurtransferase